jgi:outer membrane PBP1 activator LpoA protein
MLNFRFAVFFIFVLLLAACSSGPKQSSYLSTIPQEVAVLSQVDGFLIEQRYLDAQNALAEIDVYSLSDLERIHFYWLTAKLSVSLGRGTEAITALNAVLSGDFSQLEGIDPNAPSFLRASALHLQGQYVASARERMFLSGVLTDDLYDQNHQAIWNSLLQANDDEITKLSLNTSIFLFKGWLDLALIIKRNQIDIDKQLSQLRLWQAKYKNHPAAKNLPGDLDLLEDFVENKAKYIAIMLPLSGKLGGTGIAVRDGIMAAYYQAKAAGASVPEIRIYDTAQTSDFWSLYQQAISDGNELVIGPLSKPSVSRLQQEKKLPVPTLALNYGIRDATENPDLLFQFGLAVEDEADLVASYARQQGYQNGIALIPKGAWGERVFNRFSETWQAQGGRLIEAQFFTGKSDYNRVISKLFAIDDSERRAKNLRKQLGTRIEFQARRRDDIDFVFVAARPEQARQIKPTLAFNFAKDIPMIATSQIYSGKPSKVKDRDLNTVVFCDIPWVLENSPLKRQIHKLWPKSKGGLDRLYALGIDSFQLFPRLGQIKVLKNSRMRGQTGQLAMDRHGQIIRSLPFAIFEKGLAKKTQGYVINAKSHQGTKKGI